MSDATRCTDAQPDVSSWFVFGSVLMIMINAGAPDANILWSGMVAVGLLLTGMDRGSWIKTGINSQDSGIKYFCLNLLNCFLMTLLMSSWCAYTEHITVLYAY